MPTNYFQTTQDLNDLSPFILKHPKIPNSILADNLFRKKLYKTPKKDIPALLDFHYQRCDEPSEFALHIPWQFHNSVSQIWDKWNMRF